MTRIDTDYMIDIISLFKTVILVVVLFEIPQIKLGHFKIINLMLPYFWNCKLIVDIITINL